MKLLKFFSALILVFGATSLALAEPIGQTNQEVESIATPILENILEGMRLGDYAKISKDFDTYMKTRPQKEYYQVAGTIGDCAKKEFLGFYTKKKMTVALWKARYNKAEDDILIMLVVSKEADKYVVTGFWFK